MRSFEKAENRDVALFGSIRNAKVPAPTPRLSPELGLLLAVGGGRRAAGWGRGVGLG